MANICKFTSYVLIAKQKQKKTKKKKTKKKKKKRTTFWKMLNAQYKVTISLT